MITPATPNGAHAATASTTSYPEAHRRCAPHITPPEHSPHVHLDQQEADRHPLSRDNERRSRWRAAEAYLLQLPHVDTALPVMVVNIG